MAKFPDSLSSGGFTQTADPSAYDLLTTTDSDLIEHKLEIGLLQLHLEAYLSGLTELCSTTSDDSTCNLSTMGLTATYTAPVASWEYLLRASIELERSGSQQLPAPDLGAIEDLVTARIGTALPLNSGLFTRLTSGSYRYEMIITTDIGFGNTIYTVRWSKDRTIAFISLPELDAGDVESLQSSTRNKPANAGFNNSILRTSYIGGNRVERQLNLSQPARSSDLYIETQHTEFGPSTRNDYHSIGNASDSGGYLKSENT